MKPILILIFACTLFNQTHAQMSLNGVELVQPNQDSFSFLVGGHFYGKGTNKTKLPASTIMMSLDTINNSGFSFLMSLGDLFKDVRNDIPYTEKHFFNRLQIPLFNAVGDHDVSGSVYYDAFGETFYSFKIGDNQFIVLDTELNDSYIKNDQLVFLKKALTENLESVRNVFIFSHRPIWAEENPSLQSLFKNNTNGRFGTNFKKIIYPVIRNILDEKKVFWFSGSTGEPVVSYFYHQPEKNLNFIQNSIGNRIHDGLIRVNIAGSKIAFETMPLIEDSHFELTHYDKKFWEEKKGTVNPLTLRQKLGYVYMTITDYRFIYGFIFSLMIFSGFRFFKQKL